MQEQILLALSLPQARQLTIEQAKLAKHIPDMLKSGVFVNADETF